MTVDVNGDRLYVDDEVEDLAKGTTARVISFPRDGQVFLTTGVQTRADRVALRL